SVKCLPDMRNEVRRPHHRIARLAVKCLRELRHVRYRSGRPPFCRRVRVGLYSRAELLRAGVTSPRLGIRNEEPLLRRVAVNHFTLSSPCKRALERVVSSYEPAEVSEIFPEC